MGQKIPSTVLSKNRIFPSIPAAIVMGAVVTPFFLRGWQFLDTAFHNQAYLLIWALVAFAAPVLFATFDLGYARRRLREVGSFRPLASREDFKHLYIPAWIRMGVLTVSALISELVLTLLGLASTS